MNEKQSTVIPQELVLRAQAGDPEAFTALYERSSKAIYRTVYSMVQNEDTVWDIHQNTYIQAYRGLRGLEKPEAFLPWLRRIAVREAVRELTKDRPLTFTELAGPEEEEPQFADTRAGYQPEIELDQKEAGRLVREILEKLPEKQKLILGMYYYEGCSIREIADALHVTQGTVKTQLHLGRKKVETEVRRLEKEGVKLYGLAPMAFLMNLLGSREPPRLAEKRAARAVLEKTVSGETVTVTAKAAGTGFFHTVLGKATIGALAVLAAGGGVFGAIALRRGLTTVGDLQPTTPALVVSEPEPAVSEPITTEAPEETAPQTVTEPDAPAEEAFSWTACDFDDNILAVIYNGPLPAGSLHPTVIWNEGDEDSLVIYPRSAGSTVSASRILRDGDGNLAVEDAPVYSTLCGAGDSVGASLARPKEGPAWVVSIQAPDGREASWVLARNSRYGTPCCEYLTAGERIESSFGDHPEEQCLVAEHILKQVGYGADSEHENDAGNLPDKESSPYYSLGNALVRSIRRASEGSEAHPESVIINDCFEGDAAAGMARECRMEGDTCCLDTAVLHEYYMNELYEESFVEGQGRPELSLAERVAGQAEHFAEERILSYVPSHNQAAEGEVLHFDLYGILVYNPTLSAKTVSVTVNGLDAGRFALTEGDFFTWIPLEFPDQPADKPVRVEARVTETWFGTPEGAILDLWPSLGSNLSGAR